MLPLSTRGRPRALLSLLEDRLRARLRATPPGLKPQQQPMVLFAFECVTSLPSPSTGTNAGCRGALHRVKIDFSASDTRVPTLAGRLPGPNAALRRA